MTRRRAVDLKTFRRAPFSNAYADFAGHHFEVFDIFTPRLASSFQRIFPFSHAPKLTILIVPIPRRYFRRFPREAILPPL